MKLAIVNLSRGNLSGGYLKYLNMLVPLLRADPRIAELNLHVPAQLRDRFQFDLADVHFFAPGAAGLAAMKREVRQSRPDVIFVPTARWIGWSGIPTVVMVRNMEPLVVPFSGNSGRECVVNLARAFSARRACVKAARVIAVSEYVRSYVMQRWKVPPASVGLVYHGAERPPAVHQTTRPSSIPDGMPGRFLFTAGSIRPARGLEDVARAFALVRGRHFERLIIAGSVNPSTRRYRERMVSLLEQSGVAGRVVWAGHLDRGEMSWCFHNCSAFVMTSRAEACPNVVLEAMAHGCLCVSTDSPPMPEFFGDAALYYPSGDVGRLAERLEQAVAVEEEACRLRSKALRRSLLFSWENTARRTVDELERVLN